LKILPLLIGTIVLLYVTTMVAKATVLFVQGPPNPAQDRGGSAISNPETKSPISIKPSNIKTTVAIDTNMTYTVSEKIGDSLHYRAQEEMSFQEFAEYQRKKLIDEKWKQLEKAESDSEDNKAEDLLFRITPPGVPPIEIKPTGNVIIDFGWRWQYTANPAIPVRQQRTGGFNFDQQIKLGLTGNIGERLKVDANWDTKAAFAFDNAVKIKYESKETDIIRSVQAGNVSFKTNSTLISSANNLFGLKTDLQFGRLAVSSVISNQRGKRETMIIKGGAQSRSFEMKVSQYDENRHLEIISKRLLKTMRQALTMVLKLPE
jgi:cell surface protein SprA